MLTIIFFTIGYLVLALLAKKLNNKFRKKLRDCDLKKRSIVL